MYSQQFDAQAAFAFATRQASIIEPFVYRMEYAGIQYPDLIPVDRSGSEFATSVTYFRLDQYGVAGWINGNADDINKAGTTRAKFETPVYTAGAGYGWGFEELGRAQMLGINLQADDAMAARRAAEEMVDRVALLGDTEKGLEGLYDYSTVPVSQAVNGDWSNPATTGAQMAADMNGALLNVFNATNTTRTADRLLLPWSMYLIISTTQYSTASDLTVLEWFLRNNITTAATGRRVLVRGVRELDTAGTSGTGRMIAYRYSPEVLKMHMPMPFKFLPVWHAGPLRYDVPGVMRLGGLDIRLPSEVAYVDQLT